MIEKSQFAKLSSRQTFPLYGIWHPKVPLCKSKAMANLSYKLYLTYSDALPKQLNMVYLLSYMLCVWFRIPLKVHFPNIEMVI